MKDFTLPIWISNYLNRNDNCEYPHSYTATDAAMLKKLVEKDHVFISFKNNYRNKTNFQHTDSLVSDCDNDHSDKEDDWITPEKIKAAFPDVSFVVYTSRHHMKWKGNKSPRPRYHVIFFIERITDPDEYTAFIKQLCEYFPYFDKNAQDAARLFYGSPNAEVCFYKGTINLSQFFDVDSFARLDREIREGSRNSTMFKWAVRSMKRYGNTSESMNCFYRQAEKCTPPLDDRELQTIWRSAERYYRKIASQPDYISPDDYNGTSDPRWTEPIPFIAIQ